MVTWLVRRTWSWCPAWSSCDPEDAVFEAMLRGWRAQQAARGLRGKTIDRAAGAAGPPVPGVHQRVPVELGLAAATEEVDAVADGLIDVWLRRRSGATQTDLRLFSEYLCDGRYGWGAACEEAFGQGTHPVPICHEWNTIAT